MEPVVMAITHAAATFDETLSTFVPQLLSSRNKKLNSQAQAKAIAQEEIELGKLHNQMINSEPINSHYEIFDDNKELIELLNQKIADTLKKKFDLVQWYARTILKESLAIAKDEKIESEAVNNRLSQKSDIEREIKFYDSELEHLQRRRANLWNADTPLQDRLLSQEKKRNGQLDMCFCHYSSLLEKIYLRHDYDRPNSDKKILKKITATSQFLVSYFNNSSKDVSHDPAQEIKARYNVAEIENGINGEDSSLCFDLNDKDLSTNHNKNHLVVPIA